MARHKPDGNLQAVSIASRNQQSVMRVGLMLALTGGLALTAPSPLMPAVFSSMTLIGAMVIGLFALFLSERVHAPHFTRWDEAAALFAMSLLSGLFIDPAAVEAAVQEHMSQGTAAETGAATPPTSSTPATPPVAGN